ncbi:hypothetical protein K458DRAFT_375877, partial [Lentithecium fluviatile CBS 122367]
MVYRGPSTGCKRCRERHTKCDETKPACRRCTKRGYVCPGYRDFGGVVFQDDTRRIVEKQSRRARKVSEKSVFTPLTGLRPDAYSIVIPFFFERHIMVADQTGITSRGHFNHLIAMYSNATPSSP